ncbi:hypothetical protein [Flavobacterium poyangense]|uniref:hypothetical protein n=1 Tax=Flavobacterium poyangense TaxID=2204302 RepID=UPI0014237CF1|nr:hypothetical protein [Flavobacterium sp. JXAS1]
MNKKLLLLFFFSVQIGFSQQIEFGANVSYGFSNIANSRTTEGRAVIGNALWNIKEGFSVLYYFGDPHKKVTNGIHFEYVNSTRGSKSDSFSRAKYTINSKSFNLNYRRAGSLGNNFGIYADLGFGYNILDNTNSYKGEVDETVAFPRIKENLIIKNNEFTFIFAIGADKLILKDNFAVFIEINGEGGITTINSNSGSYRTQSLGFSTGIRYILKTKKQQ